MKCHHELPDRSLDGWLRLATVGMPRPHPESHDATVVAAGVQLIAACHDDGDAVSAVNVVHEAGGLCWGVAAACHAIAVTVR